MTPRLFIAPERLAPGALELTGDAYHYLFRVLRLQRGAAVVLLDGSGRQADAVVEQIDADCARLRVGEPSADDARAPCRLTVLLPLIKGDRTDWAIQKLVELGVDRIVPVRTERCVVRLEGKRAEDRHRRYTAIADAAARQCRRPTMPEVAPIADLSEALAEVPRDALRLVVWECARGNSLRAALPASAPAHAALLIGPEGGLSAAEAEEATQSGWTAVGLGPRILRAETAAITAAVIVAAEFGNLD